MKVGTIGVIGLPNAGKSTLINLLVGEKVGIVTSKPQTTRKRVIGILNENEHQLVFIDAPGRIKSRSGLNAFLQAEFEKALSECDVILLIINLDAKKWRDIEALTSLSEATKKPIVGVITKDDLPHPERILKAREFLKEKNIPCVSVSARKVPSIARELVLDLLLGVLQEAEAPLYERDIFTTQSAREIVEEVVREKCFESLHQEVPYNLTTQVIEFNESKGNRPEVHCDIVVARESHVKMVIGRGGENLKQIGTLARLELEKVLGYPIILKTHVRCIEGWTDKPHKMTELGYGERL